MSVAVKELKAIEKVTLFSPNMTLMIEVPRLTSFYSPCRLRRLLLSNLPKNKGIFSLRCFSVGKFSGGPSVEKHAKSARNNPVVKR
jgi:hypothetical protein